MPSRSLKSIGPSSGGKTTKAEDNIDLDPTKSTTNDDTDDHEDGWECAKCNESNPPSRKRCKGCLGWKGGTGGRPTLTCSFLCLCCVTFDLNSLI